MRRSIFLLVMLCALTSLPIWAVSPEQRVAALEKTFDDKSPIAVASDVGVSDAVVPPSRKRKFQWTPEIKQKYLEHQANLHTQQAHAMSYGALGAAGASAVGALEIHLGMQYSQVFSYVGYGIGGFAFGMAGLGILLAIASKSINKSDAILIAGAAILGSASVMFPRVTGAIFLGAMGFVGALLAITLSALAIDQALKAREKNKELENLKL